MGMLDGASNLLVAGSHALPCHGKVKRFKRFAASALLMGVISGISTEYPSLDDRVLVLTQSTLCVNGTGDSSYDSEDLGTVCQR